MCFTIFYFFFQFEFYEDRLLGVGVCLMWENKSTCAEKMEKEEEKVRVCVFVSMC